MAKTAQRKRKSSTSGRARKRAPAQTTREDASGSGGRAIWSGSISFGLLQIPIALHGAERRAETIRFRLLDRNDMNPIRNLRVNSETGKAVEWDDIVKGYEYEPGSFVPLEDEDLEKANPVATQTIDILDCVPADAIEPAFFETPYFTVPSKRSRKAWVLLRDALAKKNAAAIATFVLRTREQLCALMPVGDAIMLETLRYGHELRRAHDLPLPDEPAAKLRITPRELDMAARLIDEMMSEWKPDKYQDHYHDDVMKMIGQKLKTGRVRTPRSTKPKGQSATNVVDLVAVLRRSMAAKGKARARKAA
jgi:DNA end-binding protein Ku